MERPAPLPAFLFNLYKMKIPQQQRDELINGLLPLLGPAIEPGTELMPTKGATIISNGVTRDVKNELIVGGKTYLVPVEKMVPVDHKFKIAELIDKAKDILDMQEKLAEYLSKYAKSKEVVINHNKQ